MKKKNYLRKDRTADQKIKKTGKAKQKITELGKGEKKQEEMKKIIGKGSRSKSNDNKVWRKNGKKI